MNINSFYYSTYVATIVSDMNMRSSYNLSSLLKAGNPIVSDMNMRSSYNEVPEYIECGLIVSDMNMRSSYN